MTISVTGLFHWSSTALVGGRVLGFFLDPGTTLANVCSSLGSPVGCQNPAAFSLPSYAQGALNGGYYDMLGRRFFLGIKANF